MKTKSNTRSSPATGLTDTAASRMMARTTSPLPTCAGSSGRLPDAILDDLVKLLAECAVRDLLAQHSKAGDRPVEAGPGRRDLFTPAQPDGAGAPAAGRSRPERGNRS